MAALYTNYNKPKRYRECQEKLPTMRGKSMLVAQTPCFQESLKGNKAMELIQINRNHCTTRTESPFTNHLLKGSDNKPSILLQEHE